MECPRIEKCPLFAEFTLQGSLRVWTEIYCKSDHTRCERFQMASRNEPVPPRMLPNGKLMK